MKPRLFQVDTRQIGEEADDYLPELKQSPTTDLRTKKTDEDNSDTQVNYRIVSRIRP